MIIIENLSSKAHYVIPIKRGVKGILPSIHPGKSCDVTQFVEMINDEKIEKDQAEGLVKIVRLEFSFETKDVVDNKRTEDFAIVMSLANQKIGAWSKIMEIGEVRKIEVLVTRRGDLK